MKHYSEDELQHKLVTWQYKNLALEKEFVFSNFSEAFAFMTRVALLCEMANHHPEWCNVYNKVHIKLSTHSENAITDLDIELAKKIDAILGF
jgi:4a-hydroxytetrahydrobiopterin dehydratase